MGKQGTANAMTPVTRQIAFINAAHTICHYSLLILPTAVLAMARPGGAFGRAELDSARAVDKAYWRLFWRQPEVADAMLSPTQRQLFPLLGIMLGTPARQRETGYFRFGFPVPFVPARGGA